MERESRVREFERAEIAAHLHDSVLQTLTLIRAHAAEPDTVSRLARAQERDLRSYLYQERRSPSESVAAALAASMNEVEDALGVAIEVVSVGDAPTTIADGCRGECRTRGGDELRPPRRRAHLCVRRADGRMRTRFLSATRGRALTRTRCQRTGSASATRSLGGCAVRAATPSPCGLPWRVNRGDHFGAARGTAMSVRVVVVDDHDVIRVGVRRVA